MKQSAGILLYKLLNDELNVLLVHPGGPFWAKKDSGAWTIPKGELDDNEAPLIAAQREFMEETGHEAKGSFIKLMPLKQKSGKLVHAWALEGDLDVTKISSNTFELEWPPRSGKYRQFPEIDQAQWFGVKDAMKKILPSQQGFITELITLLNKKQ